MTVRGQLSILLKQPISEDIRGARNIRCRSEILLSKMMNRRLPEIFKSLTDIRKGSALRIELLPPRHLPIKENLLSE
jgi:hypothetical protein